MSTALAFVPFVAFFAITRGVSVQVGFWASCATAVFNVGRGLARNHHGNCSRPELSFCSVGWPCSRRSLGSSGAWAQCGS
jgi:hypothetical protein